MNKNFSHPTVLTEVPPNLKQLLHDTWDKQNVSWPDYAESDDFHQAALQQTENAVLELQGQTKFPSLIDLGCGSGHFLREIRERFQFYRLAGMDYCKPAIQRAISLDVSGLPRIQFIPRDLELPLRPEEQERLGHYNFAVATFVVDEIDDIEAFFRTAHSLLQPNSGRLICAMLDESRERARYSLNSLPRGSEQTRIIVKQTKTDPYGVDLEYYRIIRPKSEPVIAAGRAGLFCDSDKTFSPADLNSRLDGPSLRLLVFSHLKSL